MVELRQTFDTAAELYDVARPEYPAVLYDDLLAITGLGPPARLLEIGPGTGKATLPLAARGFEIIAIELGPELARVARRNLETFPNAAVEVANFETWPLPQDRFDLVYSACAFAWLDRGIRVAKAASALRAGGWLAVWTNQHVLGGTRQFFIDVQDCYERFDPATPQGLRQTPAEDVPDDPDSLANSPDFAAFFEPPIFRRYPWDLDYTTETYLDVLGTYSGHIALRQPNRGQLFDCIRALIDSRYHGAITKSHLTQLFLARRR